MPRDKYQIELEVRKIGEGLEQVKREMQALGSQVKAEGAKIRAETARMEQGFKGISGTIRRIKGLVPAGLAAFFGIAGIARLARGILDTGIAFETLRFQLRAVSKTAAEADEEFKMIREFAAKTPFLTENVTRAFIMLKAVGLAPTRREMEVFGDTAFAMGRDITDVSQSIIALETEVLRRLGIQLDRTGKKAVITSGEMRVEVENNVNAIRDAVIEVWERRFPGAMKKAEETTKGAVEIFKSEWTEFKNVLAEEVLPTINKVIRASTEFLSSLRPGTIANMEKQLREYRNELNQIEDQLAAANTETGKSPGLVDALSAAYYEATGSVKDLKDRKGELIEKIKVLEEALAHAKGWIDTATGSYRKQGEAVRDLKKEMEELDAVMKEHLESGERLGQMMAEQLKTEQALRELESEREEAQRKDLETLRKELESQVQALKDFYGVSDTELQDLKIHYQEAADEMSSTWKGMTDDLRWSLEAGLFDVFKDGFKDLESAAKGFLDMLVQAFARAVAKMIAEWITFKMVTQLAGAIGGLFGGGGEMEWGGMYQHGGLIREPVFGKGFYSHRPYLFGEAGPEAVIPSNLFSSRREQAMNIYLVDERPKARGLGPNDVILVVSEDIRGGGPIQKTIKRFT